MSREDYQQVKEVFQAALECSTESRSAYLDEACAGNAPLRQAVERLLESYDSEFLERPAVAEVIEIIEGDFSNEPTQIYFTNETSVTEPEEVPDATDANALPASRLRFALVGLLFVNMFVFAGINVYQVFSTRSSLPFTDAPQGDRIAIVNVREEFEDAFQVGDELISVNGIEISPANIKRFDDLAFDAPGERRTIVVRRGSQLREVETVAVPPPLSFRANRILYDVLLRAIFLITGLLIFLFKPNDKQALLLVLIFNSALASTSLSLLKDLPPVLLAVKAVGLLIITFCAPLFLHFCLVFPERSTLLRRSPQLERLIYLPSLLIVLPIRLLLILQFAGYSLLTSFSTVTLLQSAGRYTYNLHFLVGIAVLIFTYRRSGEIARRKLQVSVVGLLCSFTPFLLNGLVLNPLLWFSEIRNPWHEWMPFIVAVPLLLTPLVSAYAIVRDRVIPVSFVIRRGLQYLFAKNALRLFLILPILGTVWNIAANPDRTVYDILLNNSFSFYFFIALAAGFGLLMRSHLSESVDRRFFREQYDQERVLRELIEAVKESDSLAKLARLVSSKIQAALHPTSIYLFFQAEDSGDFTVGYSMNEKHADIKLAAESSLIRFMQREERAVEFPARQTDNLPHREQRWLREMGANLLVPMHGTDGRLAGIFSLGEKMSQIPYTNRDKELLETLANQIALVHENLGLKDRVRREQRIKTEVLSRFDEADINLLKECPACGRCFDRAMLKCADDDSNLTFTLPVERTIENRYRLEKLLGKGGMGAVYEATDTRLNRAVAVKILGGAMFGNRDALRRFEREAQTAGKLNHRNIVTVFDYGVLSTEGAFLVMELVKGETLSAVLKREGTLAPETVREWFGQVLDGVEAAHQAGIVHRDLKPDNILVTRGGGGGEEESVRLCILDFGLARFSDHELSERVTVPGTVMGTPGYMPPEQLRGERTDERGDLFALGVMIYECLHGLRPYAGKTHAELTRSMSKELTFYSHHPFAKVFERSLAQQATARYASASEMRDDISKLALTFIK